MQENCKGVIGLAKKMSCLAKFYDFRKLVIEQERRISKQNSRRLVFRVNNIDKTFWSKK